MFDPYAPIMGRTEVAPEWCEVADLWMSRFQEFIALGTMRLGQVVYNACPLPIEGIAGSDSDCFYDNSQVERFVESVYELWTIRRNK